ncbi:STAS domain-containing protein [Paracidovorax wautersii]|uniref:Anti-anti-sigma factor n=1 Tax=Paracidovorax wautersii TaxID=1177982 RepID=A0A1I2GGL7_9BURK|nr:STAS domain-containing protein [Paracidovorax wautersii]SFF16745.1 anti-anti-sigma factor [Paracidovorax wautersii]
MSGAVTLLPLDGELNIYRAAELRLVLLAAISDSPAGLDIDLSGVSEIDSAGVQLLLAARRDLQARGVPLRLVEPSAEVRQLFDLFDLSGEHLAGASQPAALALDGATP